MHAHPPFTFTRLGAKEGTFSLSQMSKGKLAFTLPWREKVRDSEAFTAPIS